VTIERLNVNTDRVWHRLADGALVAGLLAASLFLYIQTLAPTVAALYDDSLEFPLVAQRLAIAHPTGYPLYSLLAALFARGPWANVAWGVNLLSAVAAATTVALVYLVIRELGAHRLGAVLGAVALAVSPVFWSQAVVAEVYTLNSAFVAALLWLALRWARHPLQPVVPFARLLVMPPHPGRLFLPGEGLRQRVPVAARRAGGRVRKMYRRAFPAVPPKARLQPHPLLYALAAVWGLALTHHRTVILLAPAVLIFLLLVEPRVLRRAALLGPEWPAGPRWLRVVSRPITFLLLALLAPLLLYLYLPLRGHVGSLDGSYQNTLSGFWRWVTASSYSAFFADNPLARELDAAFYARLFWEQFGPIGLALGVVGAVALLLRRRRALALTGVGLVSFVAFAIFYRVPDVEVFFLPAFLLVAVWLGVGLDYAAYLLRRRGPSAALRRFQAICLLLVVVAAVAQPLAIAAPNYPELDLSRRWIVHDWGTYVLDEPMPAGSTVVGLLGEATLLRYLQETTGRRPGLETVAADPEIERRSAVDAAIAAGRAVYVTRPVPGLADRYSLDAVTGVIRVLGEPETLARVAAPGDDVLELPRTVEVEPVPGLALLGYGVRQHGDHWQKWARLRLWWRAPEQAVEPFKISARLLDGTGTLVAMTDAEPVSGLYPVTAWRPGEVVADAYEIPLPAGVVPGTYVPLIVVYDPASGAEWGRVRLDPVSLAGNSARPPRRALEAQMSRTVYARFRDVELLGFTPPAAEVVYRPGSELPLVLLWRAGGGADGPWALEVLLEGGGRSLNVAAAPVGGSFPVDAWQPDQVVRQWLTLSLPADVPAGDYVLRLRVLRGGRPVPWSRGWLPGGSDLDLGEALIGTEAP
jgi:hypothetical protein